MAKREDKYREDKISAEEKARQDASSLHADKVDRFTNEELGQKDEKLKDLIKKVAGEFMQRESNYTSLITITDVSVSDRGRVAKIFFTVLPDSKEKAALDFAKRQRSEFREFFSTKSRMRALPFFDFEIDRGEKNRQVIDEIARNV